MRDSETLLQFAMGPVLQVLQFLVIIALVGAALVWIAAVIAMCLPTERAPRRRTTPEPDAGNRAEDRRTTTDERVPTVRYRTLLVSLFAIASGLGAQAAPPVEVRPTTLMRTRLANDDFITDLTGSPGGGLVYYTTGKDLRVYNRAKRTSSVVLTGAYVHVTTSTAGDQLIVLREAENAPKTGRKPAHVWTVAVNRETGAATATPRRVSMSTAETPRMSPDGRLIVFVTGTPGKLVLIPATGGQERVLTDAGDPHGPVRWSPDGKWIYFAQSTGQGPQKTEHVARVSVDGGAVMQMTPPVMIPDPGLALDGKHIVAVTHFNFSGAEFSVFDLERRVVGRGRVVLEKNSEPMGFAWSGDGMHALIAIASGEESIHAINTVDGASRIIPAGDRFPRYPLLSPDGRSIAGPFTGDTALWTYMVMNADGSGVRAGRVVPMQDLAGGAWSPDSKHIVTWGDSWRSLFLVDPVTAKEKKIATSELDLTDVRWRPDSRGLLYTKTEGTPKQMRVAIREVSIDGQDRLVRDITPLIPPTGDDWHGGAVFLGDSAVLVIRQGLVIPLNGGPARRIYEPRKVDNNNPGPARARDGRWVALPAADRKSFELIPTDGSARRTLNLPGTMRTRSYRAHSDNRSLVVVIETAPPASAAVSMLLVPVDGSAPRTLVAFADGEEVNDITISADGTTVVYTKFSAGAMAIQALDLGAALRAGGGRN